MYKKKYVSPATVLLGFLLVTLFFFPAQGNNLKSAKGLNLMVITLDTLRSDHVGAYGHPQAKTPNLDKLAGKGVLFENCYTSVPLTLPSHCSIFTGKYPISHRVRENGTYFLDEKESTLAEKMKEKGYRTYAVISSFVLLSKFGLNQGFDYYDDFLENKTMVTGLDAEIKADQVYSKFRNWFEKNGDETNFFAWVHFYDPHKPYEPPREYRGQFTDNPQGRYDGEIAFTDFYVGKIIADLQAKNILDKTLIIIAGDHGEAFGEHKEYGHARFCYEENLRTPLIFFNPGLFPGPLRVKNRVNLIDIMPTLSELYGLKNTTQVQGKSLVKLLQGGEEKELRTYYIESMHGKETMGWAPLTGVIAGHYKYISLPEAELYNLEEDKEEKNNLFLKKKKLAREMDQQLMKLVKSGSALGGGSQRGLTESDKKKLQSLGYISVFSNKSHTNIDPKKGIEIEAQFDRLEAEIKNAEPGKAEALLKKLMQKNPEAVLPHHYGLLDEIYKKENNRKKIIENLMNAIKKFPGNDEFKIKLAYEFFDMNRLSGAEKLANDCIKQNAKNTEAYVLKSKIEEKRGRDSESLHMFEKALALEPLNVSLKIGYARLLGKNKMQSRAAGICRDLLKEKNVSLNHGLQTKIGVVLTEIREDDLALQVLNGVTAAGKADAVTWNYSGIIYFRKQDFQQSLQAYSKSIDLDPKVAKTYNNLGTLYLTMFLKKRDPKLHGEAIAAFNRALKIEPELVSALNGRGAALKFAGRDTEALKDWEKITVIQPNFIDVYFNIGITCLQLKMKAKALKYLRMCKEKFYNRLSPRNRNRLDQLIREAEN